ncbi:O-antigen ligase family protein [Collinsella sp. HCP28S3_E12]|uniref:O-antigen ligase family protein n=1 Tax=Collinsella sp. HCP28S3_E12 TaxID=3438921 RepID=UPI003F8939FE
MMNLGQKTGQKLEIGFVYFAIFSIFSLTLVQRGTEFEENIDVFHIFIPFSLLYLFIALSVLCFLVLCALRGMRHIQLDSICLMLALWIVLQLVDSLRLGRFNELLGAVGMAGIALVSYVIGRNTVCSKKQLVILVEFFLVAICFQTIAESLMGSISFFGDPYYYKHDLIIPIGASNYIATKIVPLFFLAFIADDIKERKIVIAAVFLVALVLTKSRNGILCFVLVSALYFIINKKITSVKKILIVACTSALVLFLLQDGLFHDLTLVYSSSSSTVDGRFDLWSQYVDAISEHLFFGQGMARVNGFISSHNVVLDVLLRGGMVGLAIVFTGIAVFFQFTAGNNGAVYAYKWFFVAEMLISMAEITFFTTTNDITFFFILGLAVSSSCHRNEFPNG